MLPFQTVLCAVDFEAGSARALVQAADLAERAHATLHLLHVSPVFRARLAHAGDDATGGHSGAFERDIADFVNRTLGAADAFDVLGPHVHQTYGESPVEGILHHAHAIGADLVVVGTHSRQGLGHFLLGSVAAGVLRRSSAPVLVVPERAEAPGAEAPVVIAVDFSDLTRPAARLGVALADTVGAPLAFVHARGVPPERLVGRRSHPAREAPPSRIETHRALDALADEVEAGTPYERYVVPGDAKRVLVDLVERTQARALVIGTRGKGHLGGLGSVAEWVTRHAPCPVLVVHAEPLPHERATDERKGAETT